MPLTISCSSRFFAGGDGALETTCGSPTNGFNVPSPHSGSFATSLNEADGIDGAAWRFGFPPPRDHESFEDVVGVSSGGIAWAEPWPTVDALPHQAPAKPSPHPFPVAVRLRRERVVAVEMNESEKGSIATLQEFVQGCKQAPVPPNCSILQWSFEQRMVDSSLEFRAKVAFLLDGIPHHVLGTWQPAKRLAKRDVAMRAIGLYAECWNSTAALEPGMYASWIGTVSAHAGGEISDVAATKAADTVDEALALARVCAGPFVVEQPSVLQATSAPRWHHNHREGAYKAFVDIELFGVVHTFAGCEQASLVEACRDTAQRVLWYLQQPGYQYNFAVEPGACHAAKEIRGPPAGWTRDRNVPADDLEAVHKKTVLMRLQNRLQQTYAQQIEVGRSVICWSYERQLAEQGSPALVRATAYIPAAERSFLGGWQKTQREAQIDVCLHVSAFLDAEPPPRTREDARRRGRTW